MVGVQEIMVDILSSQVEDQDSGKKWVEVHQDSGKIWVEVAGLFPFPLVDLVVETILIPVSMICLQTSLVVKRVVVQALVALVVPLDLNLEAQLDRNLDLSGPLQALVVPLDLNLETQLDRNLDLRGPPRLSML